MQRQTDPLHDSSVTNVNVPPARATPDRMRGFKIFLLVLLLALASLGIWKLYELVTQALLWYDTNRSVVWTALTLITLSLIVLGVYLFTRGRRRAALRKDVHRTKGTIASANQRTAALNTSQPAGVEPNPDVPDAHHHVPPTAAPVFRVEKTDDVP